MACTGTPNLRSRYRALAVNEVPYVARASHWGHHPSDPLPCADECPLITRKHHPLRGVFRATGFDDVTNQIWGPAMG